MKCFTSKCDWLRCFTLHKQNHTWLRRRLTFKLLYTKVSYSITQKLWHLSGLQPITLPNTTLVPKKSACFLQHTGCDIDNTSISSWIPRKLSRWGQSCFRLANKSVVYLHTGLFAHACLQSQSFNAARRLCTIKSKPDVLKLVSSTCCRSWQTKPPPWLHNLNWFRHWSVPSLIHPVWNG